MKNLKVSLCMLMILAAPLGANGVEKGTLAIEVVEGRPGKLAVSKIYRGIIKSNKVAAVTPEISGILLKKVFDEGAYVNKGQPLYEIEDSELKLDLERENVAEEIAKSSYDIAQVEYVKAQSIFGKSGMSESALNRFSVERNLALSNYKRARVLKEMAQLKLSRTVVRAPINGFVETTLLDEGNYVEKGVTQLVTIRNNDFFYVDFRVSESDLNDYEDYISKEVSDANLNESIFHLKDINGAKHPIQVLVRKQVVDGDSGSVFIRGKLTSSRKGIMPGSRVDIVANVELDESGIYLPRQSVFYRQGMSNIFVVDAGGIVQQHPIVIKKDFEKEYFILVKDGISLKNVILDPSRVSQGDKVAVKMALSSAL